MNIKIYNNIDNDYNIDQYRFDMELSGLGIGLFC